MLGVGLVTYQRDKQLNDTLLAVERHIKTAARLIVADDGSTDFTQGFCRELRIPCVSGQNRGVAWNKNRALFSLFAVLRCDVVILLEDDAMPTADGWEHDWIAAARQWGHVNLAGEWFPDGHIASGAGTPADPIMSPVVSGQVEAFTREAIMYGGYLDPRFKGYGFGHIEHTRRLVRCGYGGIDGPEPLFRLIRSPIAVVHQRTNDAKEADKARNGALIRELLEDRSYRMPWTDEAEMRAFRAEQAAVFGVSA
jgi:hypothetical protein